MRIVWLAAVIAFAGCGKPAATSPTPPAAPPVTPARPPAPPNVTRPIPATATPPTMRPAPPVISPAPAPSIKKVAVAKTIQAPLFGGTVFHVSPDGKAYVVDGKERRDAGFQDEFKVVTASVETGKPIGETLTLHSPAYLSDGGKTGAIFHWSDEESEIVVRDMASGREVVAAKSKDGREPFDFASDGSFVVTGRKDKLGFFDARTGKPVIPAVTTPAPILGMSNLYLGDSRVATGHAGGKVIVWNVKTGKKLDEFVLTGAETCSRRLTVAEDGVAAIVANEDGSQKLWDFRAKKPVAWGRAPESSGNHVMPGGRVFFLKKNFLKKELDVAICELATGKPVMDLAFPAGVEWEPWIVLASSDDGQRVFALTPEARRIFVWDLPAD